MNGLALATVDTFRNQIVRCDAETLLRSLPDNSVDMVIADPPYGVGKVSAWRSPSERFTEIAGNKSINAKWLDDLYRVQKNTSALYVFAKWQSFGLWQLLIDKAGYNVRSCIVWDKMNHGAGDLSTTYAPRHELIMFAAKGRHVFTNGRPVDILRVPKVAPGNLIHPYQKPMSLIAHLMFNSSSRGDIVLDPFMGSGTTALVAQQLGRDFIGSDLSADYVQLARDRVKYRGDDKRMVKELAAGVEQIAMFPTSS
ncbi:MAG: DNA-methyltransferase [Planctomycetota bacterium]|jgi:DNA modification methylase